MPAPNSLLVRLAHPAAAILMVAVFLAGPGRTTTSPRSLEASEPDRPATLVNSLGMQLRWIPPGRFRMGSEPGDRGHRANEAPAHAVLIDRGFLMSATETTVAQFQQFVDETGYVTEAERGLPGGFGIDWSTGRAVLADDIDFRDPGFPGFVPGPDHPAVLISWRDADAFCRWLSQREGRRYRLPTEAEWEYAARGGTSGTWWHGERPDGRDNIADRQLEAAFASWGGTPPRTAAWADDHAFLAPVGSYPANPFGLHDIHGNVWEWCADPHDDTAYARREAGLPPVRADEQDDPGFRAIRGGGWLDPVDRTRAAQRVWFRPTFRSCLLSGFRVVADVDA